MPRNMDIAIVIMLCFGVISCDLFKTRTPQEPTQASSNYIPPTDPEKVLENMVNAFHDGSKVNYIKSFSSSSFSYEPSTNSQIKYGGELMNWDLAREQRYFENVLLRLQQNSNILLTFDAYTPAFLSDTSRRIETIYHLQVPHTMAGVAHTFEGQTRFTMVQNQSSGEWYIGQWLDVGSTDSTWSDLKGVAYSQW
jgi:hypothetical protein